MYQQGPAQPGPNGMPEVAYPNPAAGNGHIPQAGPLGVGGLPPAPQNHVSPVYTFMGSPSSFMVVHPGGAGVKFLFFFL